MVRFLFLINLFFFLIFSSSAYAVVPKYDVDFNQAPLPEVIKFFSAVIKADVLYSSSSLIDITSDNPENINLNILVDWKGKGLGFGSLIKEFTSLLSLHNLDLRYTTYGYYIIKSFETNNDHIFSFYFHECKFIKSSELSEALGGLFDDLKFSSTDKFLIIKGSESQILNVRKLSLDLDKPISNEELYLVKNKSLSYIIGKIKELKLSDSCYIIPDYYSKSILFYGTDQDILRMRYICSFFDVVSKGQNQHVIFLNSISFESLKNIIDSYDLDVVLNQISENKILIKSNEIDFAEFQEILNLVDSGGVQVRVTAVIASLTDEAFNDLGVQIALNSDFYKIKLGANSFKDVSFDPTFLASYISNSFTGLLNATEGVSKGEMLSNPTITILDGESGYIHVGQNVPFVTEFKVNENGEEFSSIERKDIGVKLSVTPQVENDRIRLIVDQEVSYVEANTIGAKDIITSQQSLKSSLLVSSGQTVFLGGVKSTIETNYNSSVPYLSDVPLLGRIFTYTSLKNEKRNLVISLRTEILN